MHLKELEIFGFKSFPEKTWLKFEPGITVVVGPNGCGKSNVLDAIKWALGDQSPKSLRGAKMEDVIFNGTERQAPLSYAEVALTFCNEDKYLPIDYQEVCVTRRLYRSGESEYFINKNLVRLKDIEELFMGTGVGESTYSFVEQGKIEVFLSYKPEDKRLIFDEASGIVKYKERKRETMRRLEETQENLLRLDDIIAEVKRQIRYLERQVEKARKYKETQSTLVETEKKIAVLEIAGVQLKLDDLNARVQVLNETLAGKDQAFQAALASQTDLEAKTDSARRAMDKINNAVVSLAAQIENAESHIAVCRQRALELAERNQALLQTRSALTDRLKLQSGRVEEEKKRLVSVAGDFNRLDSEAAGLGEARRSLIKENDLAANAGAAAKGDLMELESRRVNLHNSLIQAQANIGSLLKRKQRLLLDKARIENLLKEREDVFSRVERELETEEAALGDLRKLRDELLGRQRDLSLQKETLAVQLIGKEKELIELQAYFDFLKDLQTKYDTFSQKQAVTIIFDREPKDINKVVASLKDASFIPAGQGFSTRVEAKIITLDEGQLQEKISAINSSISQIHCEITSCANAIEEATQMANRQAGLVMEEERRRQAKEQQRESINREVARLREEFELIAKELDTTLAGLSDLEAEQKESEQDLSLCQNAIGAAQQNLRQAQSLISRNTEKIGQIDVDIVRCQTQSQAYLKEKDELSAKINILEEECGNTVKGIADVDSETQDNQARIDHFNAEAVSLAKRIEVLRQDIDEQSRRKSEQQGQETVLSAEMSVLRETTSRVQQDIERLRADIHELELEVQGFEYERQKVKDYLIQVYQLAEDALSAVSAPEPMEALQEEKARLLKRKESLGEVNLIAIEEFEELKGRETFLDSQKQDLVNSSEELKKAIMKINRISREIFIETFNKIQEEFKKNFRFLFNGGRAQLILIDPENILESGVEIEVQPPGKKLQNVSLLSGGEKALTAISLIFAIFRVKPSPLCVLDEIDAPLDEANVDRFNNILKEFAAFSQFICITHNKKTMGAADILYGVTMQEKGISKVVSVKFASDQEPAAVAAA